MAIPGVLNRRLATRSPGAAVQGLKLEATLIDERNDSFTLKPLFLSSSRRRCASKRFAPHSAPWHAAPAFDTTSLACAESSKRETDGTPPRTIRESPGPRGHRSTNSSLSLPY